MEQSETRWNGPIFYEKSKTKKRFLFWRAELVANRRARSMLARALARPCAALALGARVRSRVRSRVGPIHRHVTTRVSTSDTRSNDADTSLVLFAPTLRATERVADTSTGPPPVHHFDLYRLTGPEDCDRLGLEESFTAASSLIEWAERLGERCPGERLDVYIETGEEATARDGAVVVEVKTSEEDDEDDELEDEDADPAFVDRKPRVIRLVPRGEAWRRRVDALAAKLS